MSSVLQFGILSFQLSPIRIECDGFDDSPDSQPEVADARFAS